MRRLCLTSLALVLSFGSVALATDLDVVIEADGCDASAITVGPACEIDYRVIVVLTDDASQGLALVLFDLEFDGGALAQAHEPTDLPMLNFAPSAGFSHNPDGYGGTVDDGGLLQVGGAQNIFRHGGWACEDYGDCPQGSICDGAYCSDIPGLPIGTLITGVAQPGSPAIAVTGTLTTPTTLGTYTLQVTSVSANVVRADATGDPVWMTEAAGVAAVTNLTMTVTADGLCCEVPEACCVSEGECTVALPSVCTDELGGTPQGDETVCEGDADEDGIDGACGDQCPNDPWKSVPGECGCDVDPEVMDAFDVEKDSDGDLTPDCIDECPLDPNKTELGICGCGVPDADTDGDTYLDCLEGCPNDPMKSMPLVCGCGVGPMDGFNVELDTDLDSIPDCVDQCPGEDDLLDENLDGIPDCLPQPPEGIPAVSQWGLLILVLLLMTGGKVYFGGRRAAQT